MGIRNHPPESIEQLRVCNISTECPHCGDTVTLVPAHKPVNTFDHSYFVGLCPNHKRLSCKPIFAVYQPLNDYVQERYPIPAFDSSRIHAAIPQSIREDYAEGTRCMYVDAFKAVVLMCRRVLEAVACDKLEKNAKDEDGKALKLYALIDRLHSEGFITKNLQESAHEIRHFGNYGAHPQDDGLDRVTLQEAENVQEVTWQFLYSIYVAPSKTKELKSARNAKRST